MSGRRVKNARCHLFLHVGLCHLRGSQKKNGIYPAHVSIRVVRNARNPPTSPLKTLGPTTCGVISLVLFYWPVTYLRVLVESPEQFEIQTASCEAGCRRFTLSNTVHLVKYVKGSGTNEQALPLMQIFQQQFG